MEIKLVDLTLVHIHDQTHALNPVHALATAWVSGARLSVNLTSQGPVLVQSHVKEMFLMSASARTEAKAVR